MEVNLSVKVYTKAGKEEKFDSKDIENELKAAGLSEQVAKNVTERVETRDEDGWLDNRKN